MGSRISKSVVQSIQVILVCFYLLNIVITIPISFQIGGLYCGLSFTATLFSLYFISTTLNLIARKYNNKTTIIITRSLFYVQNFILASLLQFFLHKFSNEELQMMIRNDKMPTENLMDAITGKLDPTYSSIILFFYYYHYIVKQWQVFLSYSTPIFTLLEGFFAILGIQTIGETNTWLKYQDNSNVWIITSLLSSGGVITAALYYLYRIYVTPIWSLTVQTASLLGFTLSLVGGLGVYGIVSHSGSVIESSLFFAYIVRCIYELAPELTTTATEEFLLGIKEVWQLHHENMTLADGFFSFCHDAISRRSEIIWNRFLLATPYTEKFEQNFITLPSPNFYKSICKPMWRFLKVFTLNVPYSITELIQVTSQMAMESISPAVLINLIFRLMIFYSATRIIPAIQKRTRSTTNDISGFMNALYWYSPCILIAMYTHLILQYSGELKGDLCLWGCNSKWFGVDQEPLLVDAWSFWNWCNIFWTILVYGSELFGGNK